MVVWGGTWARDKPGATLHVMEGGTWAGLRAAAQQVWCVWGSWSRGGGHHVISQVTAAAAVREGGGPVGGLAVVIDISTGMRGQQ